MSELTITEKILIDGYRNDFYFKTGKKLEVKVLSKWKSYCKLDKVVDPNELLTLILEGGGWKKEEIFKEDKIKKAYLVLKRRIVYYILYANGVSFKEIGRLSGYDHTSIIDSIKKFEDELEHHEPMQALVIEVMYYITENINSVTIN